MMRIRRPAETRQGFSLVEALVVLAISGMALAVVFSIGARAGDTGFALGRRALEAADRDLSASDFRVLVEGIVLPPVRLMDPERDTAVVGSPDRLQAEVVMTRATTCAPRGWRGVVVLAVEQGPERAYLTCKGEGAAVRVIDLGPNAGRLAYSADGVAWTDTVDTGAVDERDRMAAPLAEARLWVKLEQGRDRTIIGEASSGRPGTWVRPDELF